jgi:menaquinone-9 beta-reductase
MQDADVVIAGGGPAGAFAAIGLARAGWRVLLVTSARRPHAVEGLSERVVGALERACCRRAMAAIGARARREASWNGGTAHANLEWVVDRGLFDAALLEDARAAGVEVQGQHVRAARAGEQGSCLELADGSTLGGRFLIEARGRRAPGERIRGPATTALSRRWRGAPGPARTAIAPFADGWAWFATTGDGSATLQIALSSAHAGLPGQKRLADFYLAILARLAEAREWLGDAEPAGTVTARHAGMSRAAAPIGPGLIRIGDAALALDPLSCHGVFEAIASANAAVPVVSTMLARPEAADLARAFYDERVSTAFERFARIGRDFYRLEGRWPDAPFWAERRAWPDDLPAHGHPFDRPAAIVRKPVVENGAIVARQVVVTADHPRGVWQVAGVPLADLLGWWRACADPSAQEASRRFNRSPDDIEVALAWLESRRLLG